MKIILNKNILVKLLLKEKNIGFVPTMGGLHMGHISLIKKSISQCEKTIVSIFVNKPQFNRKSDFKKYPRLLKNDIKILKKQKIDYLFLPKEKQIYPKGINRNLKINSLERKLCGKFRPGHFRAVVDVIYRFIKIIKPKKIYLGEKDLQQLLIIKDFIRKKKIQTNIVTCKTIREKNGIPFSSRNILLSPKKKIIASQIYSLIYKNKKNLLTKKLSISSIKNKMYLLGVNKIDYIKIYNVNKLIKPYVEKINYRIFFAYYLNSVRLIDNF